VASSTTATRPPSCGHPEHSLAGAQPRVSTSNRWRLFHIPPALRRRREREERPDGRRGRWRPSGEPTCHRSRQAWWGPQASPARPPSPSFGGSGVERPGVIPAGGKEVGVGCLTRHAAPSGCSNQTRTTLKTEDSDEPNETARQFIADDGRNYKEVDSITRLVKNADGAVKPIRWPVLISMCLRSLPAFC
jgi:hypothetical protein